MTGEAQRTISSTAGLGEGVEVRPPAVALIRMAGQLHHPVADGVARGLVAGRGEQDEERSDLGVGQPLAVDLGLHQRRAQVFPRVAATVHRHRHSVGADLVRHLLEHGVVVVGLELAEDHVRPAEDAVLVLLRDAHHRADDLQRQRRGDLPYDVATPVGMALHHPADDVLGAHPHGVLDEGDHLAA